MKFNSKRNYHLRIKNSNILNYFEFIIYESLKVRKGWVQVYFKERVSIGKFYKFCFSDYYINVIDILNKEFLTNDFFEGLKEA